MQTRINSTMYSLNTLQNALFCKQMQIHYFKCDIFQEIVEIVVLFFVAT
jgi:hypothetical protein